MIYRFISGENPWIFHVYWMATVTDVWIEYSLESLNRHWLQRNLSVTWPGLPSWTANNGTRWHPCQEPSGAKWSQVLQLQLQFLLSSWSAPRLNLMPWTKLLFVVFTIYSSWVRPWRRQHGWLLAPNTWPVNWQSGLVERHDRGGQWPHPVRAWSAPRFGRVEIGKLVRQCQEKHQKHTETFQR